MLRKISEHNNLWGSLRLHTSIGDLSPIEFKKSTLKLCGNG